MTHNEIGDGERKNMAEFSVLLTPEVCLCAQMPQSSKFMP